MGRLNARTRADMTEKQRELYDQMAEGRPTVADGHLGGPFDGWNLSPSIGRRTWQLGGAIRFKPTIERRYVELAILMTGQRWRAQYEWYAHEPMARDAGLPEAVIAAVKDGAEPDFGASGDEGGDEAAWRFCRALLDDRVVDDATYGATVARFGEPGVMDLISACGFYTLVSMTLNTFEVDLPDGVEPPFADGPGTQR
ncbi:MAG: carboxymuconolactone decarboxylase family protein [Acidimicrobiales bacterium]